MEREWERAIRALNDLADGSMSKPESVARSVAKSFRKAYRGHEINALVAAVQKEIGRIEQAPGVTKLTAVQAQPFLVRKLTIMRAALDELTKPEATT
jgi:hypothetical protein